MVQADSQQGLPFSDNSFDVVIMMRVVNHLRNLDNAVSEIGRIVSPGGLLLATDLADEYEYICTRIPTPKHKISIETYKHSDAEWQRALEHNLFEVNMNEFTPAQLRRLGKTLPVGKFFAEDVPLFKLVTARKK